MAVDAVAAGWKGMSTAMDDFISCPLCDGQGTLANASPRWCARCHGRGAITTTFAAHTQPVLGRMPWESACPDCRGTGQSSGPAVVACAMCSGHGAIPRAAVGYADR